MASDDDAPKVPAIPLWQQTSPTSETTTQPEPPAAPSQLDLLEHGRRFLKDEKIRNASSERKEAFLKEKGLSDEQIQKLLSEPLSTSTTDQDDLTTVHESGPSERDKAKELDKPAERQQEEENPTAAQITPRSDLPPIITYPEFLLKPQKPPPLVTIERLVNAAYVLAGFSALTYGASKYLVQPMLESLTASRHDLYSATKEKLDTLNTKLESTVSHVPYIPPLHARKDQSNENEDEESITSDPTELFHRDMATQTFPDESPASSLSTSEKPWSALTDQSNRLASLHTSLSSLLSSTQTHFSENTLTDTMSNFQSLITSIEGNSHPMTTAYSPYNIPSSASSTELTKSASSKSTSDLDTQAAKFKAEIRALKGAFLSSRNFPSIRPGVPFTLPHQSQSATAK